MRKQTLRAVVIIGLAALFTEQAIGQITIAPDETVYRIGDSVFTRKNTDTADVQVGTPGGPQTWTFDTSAFAGKPRLVATVSPAETPFGDSFPDSHKATWMRTDTSPDTQVNFWRKNTDRLSLIGVGWVKPDTAYAVRFASHHRVLSLPMTMGTNWDAQSTYRMYASPTMWTDADRRMRARVDAWGTAVIASGSYDCLRVTHIDTSIYGIYVNGTLRRTDTTVYRVFDWWTEQIGHVASAQGLKSDTALEFTRATDCWIMYRRQDGGIGEKVGSRSARRVCAQTPFAGRTTIPGRELEQFQLFDVAGKPVAVQPGSRIGYGLRPGVYSLRSRAGETGKIVKVR